MQAAQDRSGEYFVESDSRRRWSRLSWTEPVQIVLPCHNEGGHDLIAVAGPEKVEIFQVIASSTGAGITFRSLALFRVGSVTTALAWTPASVGPALTEAREEWWKVQLVAATADQQVLLLSSEMPEQACITSVGTASAQVADLSVCQDTPQNDHFFASANQDGSLQIWNLRAIAPQGDSTHFANPRATFSFPSPLLSVSFHQSLANMLLVADQSGVCRLLDWLGSVESSTPKTLLTLVAPRPLAAAAKQGLRTSGKVAWKPQSANVIGAQLGSHWYIWDLRNYSGGKPVQSGESKEQNVMGRFCWSPSNVNLFATLCDSPTAEAPVFIYDASFPTAPRAVDCATLLAVATQSRNSTGSLAVRGPKVTDIDWLNGHDVLVIAAGREVLFVPADSV